MGLLRKFFNNTRKPEGLLGQWMVSSMNRAHAPLADWGLGHLPPVRPDAIAELGCGGGRNVGQLLRRYPAACVTAVDYAAVAVEKTRRVNRRALRAGRCRVLQGDVARLPLGDGQFDLATAFETVYFWPGPADSFREVYRILKPGGLFLVVNEADGENPRDEKWLATIAGLQIYRRAQLAEFLAQAGFALLAVDHDPRRHRLCLVAMRPR